jgi:DNA recombination protein Rad52
MAFTDEQREALTAKLRYRHVRTRASNGTPISYVEGWHVIAEANRIFGYDCWDRQTLSPRCLWRETQRGETTCFYAAKVRITVRAGDAMIVREGIGTGTGRSSAAEAAHEIALKAAETDATKRALATFGNPFGLALYDKEQRGVTRRHTRTIETDQTTSLPPTHEFELHYKTIAPSALRARMPSSQRRCRQCERKQPCKRSTPFGKPTSTASRLSHEPQTAAMMNRCS